MKINGSLMGLVVVCNEDIGLYQRETVTTIKCQVNFVLWNCEFYWWVLFSQNISFFGWWCSV